ncbi:MAG: hypothetical protein AABZ02_07070 [Bacteroidota bacterium]
MKKLAVFACLTLIFLYLLVHGCTEPQDLITPTHFTRVPGVLNLQGAVGFTPTGKRLVLVAWEYDTSNSNIRSWDLTRSVNDTSAAAFVPLEIIRKPASGFPSYSDTSAVLQGHNMVTDSVDVYYKIIPNGVLNNFVGQPSDVLHVIVRKL